MIYNLMWLFSLDTLYEDVASVTFKGQKYSSLEGYRVLSVRGKEWAEGLDEQKSFGDFASFKNYLLTFPELDVNFYHKVRFEVELSDEEKKELIDDGEEPVQDFIRVGVAKDFINIVDSDQIVIPADMIPLRDGLRSIDVTVEGGRDYASCVLPPDRNDGISRWELLQPVFAACLVSGIDCSDKLIYEVLYDCRENACYIRLDG